MPGTLLSNGKAYTTIPAPPWVNRSSTCLTDGTLNYGDNNVTMAEYRDHVGGAYYGYMRINLGAQYSIDHVRFGYFVYAPAHIYAPTTITIQGSNDDSNWTDIGTFAQSGNWTTANSGVNPHINRWSGDLAVTNAGPFQYIRFKVFYNDPVVWDTAHSFSELEVYGGTTSSIKTIQGLAKASVKTVQGLAIASVKTFNGLA